MPDPHLRAADTDREAVATALGEHMAAGRLSLAEYDERVAQAWAARTYGELARLTADLPALAPARSEQRAEAAVAPPRGTSACGPVRAQPPWPPMGSWAGHGGSPEHAWREWLTTSVTVLAIYATIAIASGELHYFWPMWVIGPWGAVLLAQALTDRRGTGRRERGALHRIDSGRDTGRGSR